MGGLAKGLALSVGLLVVAATVPSTVRTADEGEAAVTVPAAPTVQADPRVRAFVQAYGALIDSLRADHDDVVFYLRGRAIHFDGGRMLEQGRHEDGTACDPIFYTYSLQPLTEPVLATAELPVYCTDVPETLWGATESQVRSHGHTIEFLDHRMWVNELLDEPLGQIERDLRDEATRDASVAAWIDGLDVTYSLDSRRIAGSPARSYHAWGLAVDFVPTSYDGRHVYWRWSRVYDRDSWDRIPLEKRWSPPLAVVEIFERHGFVWGGKWAHFDVIHFEYRPEIILYNRLISSAGQ